MGGHMGEGAASREIMVAIMPVGVMVAVMVTAR